MTFVHLANLMQNWGFVVKPEHYGKFELYLKKMLKVNQVMVVRDENNLIMAVMTFFTTNDYEKLYKKSTWEFVKSELNGDQLYVDKMVCREWTKKVRIAVQKAIQEAFPNVKEAFYHRAPKDRCVKIERKEKYELQSTVS